jgi:hypothetical protein
LARAENAREGRPKNKAPKLEGRSKHLTELPIHPALKGAYEILMGLEGGIGTAEVVQECFAISGVGSHFGNN